MRSRTRFFLASISASAVLAFMFAAPASADPAGPTADATDRIGAASAPATVWNPDTGQAMTASALEAQEIVDAYWTPERMAEAEPVHQDADDSAWLSSDVAPAPSEAKDLAEPQRPTDPAIRSDELGLMQQAYFSYTNGKVFFHNPTDGGDYVCSGGAVNSGSKRMVVTAGHCIHPGDGSGNWMQNWVFVPGYQNGNEPRGRFAAYWFDTTTGWTQDGSRHRDFAFVTTYTNSSGQLLVNAVGGHGLTTNPGRPFVHIAGYPGNRDNGQVQWNCWGTTSRWSLFDDGQKLNCDFGGGSSGGPWLRDFDSSGLGYVISNMHGIATNGSGDNYGPYYDDHTGDIFANAANRTP